MSAVEREVALSRAFVQLADTLVSDFDVADIMYVLVEHSVALLDADAAGLLLVDARGELHLMASSTEATRLLELFQLQIAEGPCLDCVRTGEPVSEVNLAASTTRWPQFAPAAVRSNFGAVHAVPLRLRSKVLGALNMFSSDPRPLPVADQLVAQALADVATIGLLQARAISSAEAVVEQLNGALTSRVVIEQAKGLLANHSGLEMDQAFELLRLRSRSTNRRLTDVAADLVEGRTTADQVLRGAPGSSPRQRQRTAESPSHHPNSTG